MSFKLLITIILVSLLLAAGLLGYRLFVSNPAPSVAPVSNEPGIAAQGLDNSSTPAAVEQAEFSRVLARFNAIDHLKTEVLASAAFKSLYNFVFPIPNPTPGRNNPFAPVGQ